MTISEEQLRAMAEVAGIPIAPEHVPGVIRNLEILHEQCALLFDPPVDALIEPATVYLP